MLSKNIVLIGFMGTGKTSIGKILASKMTRPLVDIDAYIENQEKRKITQIFEKEGEAYFRKVESAVLQEMAGRSGMVLTTGGGAVLNDANRKALRKNSIVILLSASPETIYKRVKDSGHRPLLKGEDVLNKIKNLLEERKPFYADTDLTVTTDERSAKDVADEIIAELRKKFNYDKPQSR